MQFLILLLYILYPQAINAAPCKLFPKILGGGLGNTYIYSLDANQGKDIFAVCGETYDSGLAASTLPVNTYVPLISVFQISTTQVYWMKVDLSRTFQTAISLSFSPNGNYLIAKLVQWSSNKPYIHVYDSITGILISSKSFNIDTYDPIINVKQLLLTSDGLSAYVLGQYYPVGSTQCSGQYILKFNPQDAAQVNPSWSVKMEDNCSPWGLAFDYNQENIIIAFNGGFSGTHVSLFENNNLIWNKGLSSFKYQNPHIISESQSATATTNIVALATDTNILRFWTIEYLKASPYSINSQVSIYDPNPTQFLFRGLYIKFSNLLIAALFNPATYQFQIATVNFSTIKVRYQETFSTFTNSQVMRVVFITESLYFASSNTKSLNTPTTQTIGAQYHGAVMSSDVSNSCYTLSTSVASGDISMTQEIPASFITCFSSLFTIPSITISHDSSSNYAPIDRSKITILQWCTQIEFQDPTSIQSTSSHYFKVGFAKTSVITPFTSTLLCGAGPPTFSYQGIDQQDGLPLDLTDFISVDTTTGSISVSALGKQGTYSLKIIGKFFSQWQRQTYALFSVHIDYNLPAQFAISVLENQQIQLMSSITYKLPPYSDLDNSGPVSVSLSPSYIKDFVNYNLILNQLTFNPTLKYTIGIHQMEVVLTDYLGLSNSYPLTILVYDYPCFSNPLVKVFQLSVNSQAQYMLPVCYDFWEITVSHQLLPSFVIFNEMKYSMNPILLTDIGMFEIAGTLRNKYANLQFKFKVVVINKAPYFNSNLLNYLVKQQETLQIQLPMPKDDEDSIMSIQTTEQLKQSLPSFISFDGKLIYTVQPSEMDSAGKYQIEIRLTDIYQKSNTYFFSIIVISQDQDDISSFIKDLIGKENFFNNLNKQNNIIAKTGQQLVKRASIILRQVQRDGVLQIQIISPAKTREMLYKIDNTTVKLVLERDNIYNKQIKFEIINKTTNYDQSILLLQLFLNDSLQISQSAQLENIRLEFLQRIQCESEKYIVYIPQKYIVRTKILPQLSKNEQYIASKLQKGGLKLFNNNKNLGIFINVCISILVQLFWGQLEDMSFLTILSLIQINILGLANVIQNMLFGFITFDILQTDKWMTPYIFKENSDNEIDDLTLDNINMALGSTFEQNGLQTKNVIQNMGSTFLYLIICLLVVTVLPILIYLMNLINKCTKAGKWVSDKLFWNGILNFLMIQYPIILISSIINLFGITFNDKQIYTFSSILSIFLLVGCPVFLFIVAFLIKKLKMNNDNNISKYDILIRNLRMDANNLAIYWKFIILMRWSITIPILITLNSYNEIQVMILLIISVAFQILIISFKPYINPQKNNKMLFVEIMISLYLYNLMCLTDFLNDDMRYFLSLVLIGIIISTIFVNLILLIKSLCKKSFRFFKRLCNKNKAKKYLISGQNEKSTDGRVINKECNIKQIKEESKCQFQEQKSSNHQIFDMSNIIQQTDKISNQNENNHEVEITNDYVPIVNRRQERFDALFQFENKISTILNKAQSNLYQLNANKEDRIQQFNIPEISRIRENSIISYNSERPIYYDYEQNHPEQRNPMKNRRLIQGEFPQQEDYKTNFVREIQNLQQMTPLENLQLRSLNPLNEQKRNHDNKKTKTISKITYHNLFFMI